MTNDIARVTKLADECDIHPPVPYEGKSGYFEFLPEQLLAYTQKVEQAVLATKQDALERKCITANEEVLMKEIESLQAKLAHQSDFINGAKNHVGNMVNGNMLADIAERYANATQADVDNWMQGKKAEWEKGVLDSLREYCKATFDELAIPVTAIDLFVKERGEV